MLFFTNLNVTVSSLDWPEVQMGIDPVTFGPYNTHGGIFHCRRRTESGPKT